MSFCALNDDIDVKLLTALAPVFTDPRESQQHILDRAVVLPLIHPLYEVQLAKTNSVMRSVINLMALTCNKTMWEMNAATV